MMSRIFVALFLCVAAFNANAGLFRIDAIDPNVDGWSGPGPTPTSVSISFLMDTGTASYTMIKVPNKDRLGQFESSMAGSILDVSVDGRSLIHNDPAAATFGGDNPAPNCTLCSGQALVAGFILTSATNYLNLQIDTHHTATWADLVASSDPTGLLLKTYTPSGLPAFQISGTWGSLQAGASRIAISAVPEPSTYGMLLVGMLIVGGVARRKLGAN